MLSRKNIILASIIALLGVSLTVQPAQACMWNGLEGFSPLPPCDVEDQPARTRLDQTNERLVAKLVVIAGKVKTVREEIEAWQRAYQEARSFEQELRSIFGDVTANPLESMVAEFNRQQPLGRSIALSTDGTLNVQADVPTNLKALGDSLLGRFTEAAGLEDLYQTGIRDIEEDLTGDLAQALEQEAFATGAILDRRIKKLVDLKELQETFVDSLNRKGQRTSGRYAGVSSSSGESESKISHFSASMSLLQGTKFSTRISALQNRFESFNAGYQYERRIRRHGMQRASMSVGMW